MNEALGHSDWHLETRRGSFDQPVPEFDVLVVAGDVSNDVAESIEYVAAVARGRVAVFVLGNHEYWNDHAIVITLERAHAAATRHGVAFLECDAIDIGGVRLAGATLWTEDDVRFKPSLDFLASSRCDVAITHFEPLALFASKLTRVFAIDVFSPSQIHILLLSDYIAPRRFTERRISMSKPAKQRAAAWSNPWPEAVNRRSCRSRKMEIRRSTKLVWPAQPSDPRQL